MLLWLCVTSVILVFFYFPYRDCKQVIGVFVNLVFLGQAFTIMLVYIWSRRNPYIRMSFFGILTFHVSQTELKK